LLCAQSDVASIGQTYCPVWIDSGSAVKRQRRFQLFTAAIARHENVSAGNCDAVARGDTDVLSAGCGINAARLLGRGSVLRRDGACGSRYGEEGGNEKLILHTDWIAIRIGLSRRRPIPYCSAGATPDEAKQLERGIGTWRTPAPPRLDFL
jgi:hypothetical protein